MAERPPLKPDRRPNGPSPAQVRRRRAAALGAIVVVAAAAIVAVVVAMPHVHRTHTLPPPPPPPKPFRVVFPEGFSRAQMAVRVRDVAKIAQRKSNKPVKLTLAAYNAASRKASIPCFRPKAQHNLEGFLFPATYDFLASTTSLQLVRDQLQAFCAQWNGIDLSYARKKNLTPYDVLIIASMVEKETIAPDERPKVAAVIYNRLKARMPLGIDATIRYGLDVPGTESLRVSQLQSNNPYNTRNRTGLPPTPIANPGLASIQAAAHPAKVKYLYFVRKPDRVHHFFTASESEFFAKACEYGYGCN
jgi:UPF0755 protein